jgi:hypothetical protein
MHIFFRLYQAWKTYENLTYIVEISDIPGKVIEGILKVIVISKSNVLPQPAVHSLTLNVPVIVILSG